MQPEPPETVLHRTQSPRSILLLRVVTLSAMLAVTTACIDDSSGDETVGESGSTDGGATGSDSTDDSASSVEVDITFNPEDQSSGVSSYCKRRIRLSIQPALTPTASSSKGHQAKLPERLSIARERPNWSRPAILRRARPTP